MVSIISNIINLVGLIESILIELEEINKYKYITSCGTNLLLLIKYKIISNYTVLI